MAGTHNMQQWNPTAANQETDAQYSADAMRLAGATDPSIFLSTLANKLFYQATTYICALAQSMADKGFTLSDASLANLTSVFHGIMTTADMSPYATSAAVAQAIAPLISQSQLTAALLPYAPVASPTFTGVPLTPTPGAGDNSLKIANTAWVDAMVAAVVAALAPIANPTLTGVPRAPTPATADNSTTLATTAFVKNQNYQAALGFTPVEQGGGVGQLTNKVQIGWDNNNLRLSVDGIDEGVILGQFQNREQIASTGWQKLPSGLIVQWGFGNLTTGNAETVFLPISFTTGGFLAFANDVGSACSSIGVTISGINSLRVSARNPGTGAFTSATIAYLAIGH